MINDTKFEVSKKVIKSLNDMNQDLKTIFHEYYVYPDRTIIAEPEKYVYNIGTHAGWIENLPIEELENYILKLNSDSVYMTIKDNKKIIDSIEIRSGILYLTGDNKSFRIGEVLDIDVAGTNNISKIYIGVCERLDTWHTDTDKMNILQEDVEALVKNEYRNADIGKYSTRITRGIIPGLKKSHAVSICFSDSDDNRLYNMSIDVERANIHSNHMYTCIFTK